MMEWWNLLSPHAKPKIYFSVNKCSHRPEQLINIHTRLIGM